MSTLGDEDLIKAADIVVKSLKQQAEIVVSVKGRNLATEICSLFRPYIVQELSPQFADARTRQWAISFELHRMPSGAPMLATPGRSVIVDKSYELGDYYIAQGFNDAAHHLADAIKEHVKLEGFGYEALRAALQNLRGPISIGKGHATMRRTVIKPKRPDKLLDRDTEYALFVDVLRLDVALERYPKRAKIDPRMKKFRDNPL